MCIMQKKEAAMRRNATNMLNLQATVPRLRLRRSAQEERAEAGLREAP